MPPKANRPKRNGHRGGAHEPYAGEDKPGVKSATDLQMAMTKNQVPAADNTGPLVEKPKETSAPGKPPEKAPEVKIPALIQEAAHIRHEFSMEERLAFGSILAQGNSQRNNLEQELKSISADYKAKIKGLETGIDAATEKFNSGFEMRTVQCNVLHKKDCKPNIKCYYRADNGQYVKQEVMNMADLSMLSQPWPKNHKIEDAWLPEPPKEEKK